MKKIILAFYLLLSLQTVFAQGTAVDSLTKVLSRSLTPIERFGVLNKIIDHNDATLGFFQDTAISLQMHRIAQQLKNDSLLAISTNIIGNYFRSRSDYPTALSYFFKAIPLAEKVKDKRRISSLYFDIAECYYNLENLEECIKYDKLGEANLPDKESSMYAFMVIQFYRTMGNYYLKKNLPDSALIQIHRLEEVNSSLKKANYIMYSLIQNGTAYAMLGNNEMAEVYFKKADILSDSIATPVIRIIFNQGYIPYLFKTNQIQKARFFSLQLLNTGNLVNSNLFKLNAAGFLSQIYNRLQQADSAFFYLSMQSALKDSVFNQNNFNKIQALAFNEEVRKIDEQAKEKRSAEQRHQNIQYAAIALGIIIFITLFLLLSRTVLANEKLISFFAILGLLLVFEFINLLIHPWLASFTHESPVLMLLALVIIAALLIPLHHKMEHTIKEKLVEKNKQIRLATAKKTIEKLDRTSEDL